MGRQQILCHGDDRRFDAVARQIAANFGPDVHYVADVAGGKGLLSRLLHKMCGLSCEVIDPRPEVLRGVNHRAIQFDPSLADYYDLIVALHPDQALRAVVISALYRPTVLVPCCNFWSAHRLGIREMFLEIEIWFHAQGVRTRRLTFEFGGPCNRGFITFPPEKPPVEFGGLTPVVPEKSSRRADWKPPQKLRPQTRCSPCTP